MTEAITREERDPDLPPVWYFEEEDYSLRHEAFDEGFTHACAMLARMLGAKEWEMGDGSESWTGDAGKTLSNVIEAAGIYDPETGVIARCAALVASEAEVERLRTALKPFAEMADNIVAQIPDDDRVPIDFVQEWGDEKDSVSVEAFRRARAALTGEKP